MIDNIKLKKRDNWKAYLIIGIIILLIAAIYFTFFFYYSCNDLSCFQSHQKECVKTKFINDEEDATWKYIIQGKEGNKCEINAEVLVIKKGSPDKQKLEGKSMVCYLPLGSIASPESDLANCHGELKEDIQNLIIQKLHAYIIENVEKIDEELEQIF
jgi:hypothetical protein